MPQEQNKFIPRKGQGKLGERLLSVTAGDKLTIQWPTGYGKSIGFAMAWRHCFNTGIANRLLMVVANDVQREQIINDFHGDCELVGAPCEGGIWKFDRAGSDLATAKAGNAIVFVCTVQQLDASVRRGGVNTIKDMLMMNGLNWMVGFDEYHHYGDGMPWGDSAEAAMGWAAFSVAMSATPYRRKVDTVFGKPDMVVTYEDGVAEGALKPITCHAYNYQVTVIEDGGEPVSYTTSDMVGACADKGMSVWQEKKNNRMSPQFIHPLIVHPVERLMKNRAGSGMPLQMLVRAMSCSHAELVCAQVKTLTEGLSVDWIGTGEYGRSDEENKAVIGKFCPPKDANNRRGEPTLDVLVQVSMAGEGFDSVNVCEVVDLYPVSDKALNGNATQDKQFYGRGSRIIPGCSFDGGMELNVSVPTDHPLSDWASNSLNGWMDASEKIDPPDEPGERTRDVDLFDFPDMPTEREIELINIITNTEKFRRFSKDVSDRRDYDLSNPEHVAELEALYLGVERSIQSKHNEKSKSAGLKIFINGVVSRTALIKAKQSQEVNGAVIGRFKKEVNGKIKHKFGKSRDEMRTDELEAVAKWLRAEMDSLKPK